MTALNNRTLEATDKVTGNEGKLEATGNFHYGLNLEFSLSKSFRANIGAWQRSYSFNNEKEIIADEPTIDTTDVYLGFKWIVFSRTALRFDFHFADEVAFTQNTSNQAVLFKEGITFIDVNFDQIVYLTAKFYLGFKLGSELLISSSDIESRSEIHYGAFLNYNSFLGALEVYLQLKDVTKDTEDLDFVQNDINLNLNYTLRF